jgi:phosphohistidine phosphatase
MKTLYVLRHAKAERDSDTGKDFDRPLAERGWSDAELVGREARSRGLEIDAVLASPAKRAAQTVEAFARGFGALDQEWEQGIYNASLDRLLEIVGEADDTAERLLIVGHNPGFEMLVLSLAGNGALMDGLPTAGFAAIELPADQWSDVREGTGTVAALILPRDIR